MDKLNTRKLTIGEVQKLLKKFNFDDTICQLFNSNMCFKV